MEAGRLAKTQSVGIVCRSWQRQSPNLVSQPANRGARMPRTPGMHARTLPASGSSAIWA